MIGTYWAQPEGQRLTFPHTVRECRTEYNNQEHSRKENDKWGYYYKKLKVFLRDTPKTRLDCLRYTGLPLGQFKNFEAYMSKHCPEIWSDNVDMKIGNEVVIGLDTYDISKFQKELDIRERRAKELDRKRSKKSYLKKKLTRKGAV